MDQDLAVLATNTAGMITEARDQPEKLRAVASLFGKQLGLLVLETGQREVHQQLQRVLDSWDRQDGPAPILHYLREVYDDTFIYERDGRNGSTLYRLSYTVGDAGAVVDENEAPVEVVMKREYVTVNEEKPPGVLAARKASEVWAKLTSRGSG